MPQGIIYIQSHPIQYFAPFFAEMEASNIMLQVFYCSDESLKETLDVQFGQYIKWDIPLLQGYKSEFIKNNSYKPSIHNGFFGLINWGIVKKLREAPKSLVVVPGWNYSSYLIAIIAAKWYGHKLALRGESPMSQEKQNKGIKLALRKLLLGKVLFKMIDYALYIGSENKAFYTFYGVPEKKLAFVPFAVDNKRFQNAKDEWENKRDYLKQVLGLDIHKKIVLFSGKYIPKKRPLDILKAFNETDHSNTQLVMIGDGELRPQMEAFVNDNQLNDSVVLTGFVNQTEIVKYYAASDIFVMCSGIGETWGLSVNEAMNFGLKLIVSNTTGCSIDLVVQNKTGWTFETGNIRALAQALQFSIDDTTIKTTDIIDLVNHYSYSTGILNIAKVIGKE